MFPSKAHGCLSFTQRGFSAHFKVAYHFSFMGLLLLLVAKLVILVCVLGLAVVCARQHVQSPFGGAACLV